MTPRTNSVTDEMVEKACRAAYGDAWPDWPNAADHRHLVRQSLEALADDLRPVEASAAEVDEVARVLHVMGCVKNCDGNPSGWRENVLMVLDALGNTANQIRVEFDRLLEELRDD